jgi:hypothetical protein
MLGLFCPWARGSARKRRELHSRRWEVNPERLRRAYAKLPEDVRVTLLTPSLFDGLVTSGALHAALLADGLTASEAERLMARRLRPPLVAAVLLFLNEVLASDERTPPVLSRELVYLGVVLPLPPSMEPLAQKEPDGSSLLAVAKAAKLPRDRQPREARDARRNNRVLRHCHACGAYKLSVEFYACCLHDEQRVCRTCMLARPAEPFGEHLAEEYRTGRVLALACASLTVLADHILALERMLNRPAGTLPVTGAEDAAAGDGPCRACVGELGSSDTLPAAAKGDGAREPEIPAGGGAAIPAGSGSAIPARGAATGGPRAAGGVEETPLGSVTAATSATAATAAATTAKTATLLVRIAALSGRFGWR